MFQDIKTKAIVFGGLLSAGISVFPVISMINLICCSGFIIGGYFTVYYYHKNNGTFLSLSEGALAGLLSGIVGSLISLIFQMFVLQMVGLETLQQEIESTMTQFGLNQSDFQSSAGGFSPAEIFSFPWVLIFGILSSLIFGAFSMIGGMIRAAQDTDRARPAGN